MLRGLMLIALAAVSWGTTGSVSTILAASGAPSPLVVGLARMSVAAVLLAGVAVARGGLAIAREDRRRCVLMGLCMAAYQLTFFTAVRLAGIAIVALIAICSAPLIIAGLAVVVLAEPLAPRVRVALVLGVIGTGLLVAAPSSVRAGSARDLVSGVALALAAGLSYAVYVVLAKVSVARSAPLPLTAGTFGVAAVALTPTIWWVDSPMRQIVLGWPWLLYLGSIATAAAYALYTTGLRRVPASAAGIVGLLEPLTATALGVVVFGERLAAAAVAGALLLFAALAVLAHR